MPSIKYRIREEKYLSESYFYPELREKEGVFGVWRGVLNESFSKRCSSYDEAMITINNHKKFHALRKQEKQTKESIIHKV